MTEPKFLPHMQGNPSYFASLLEAAKEKEATPKTGYAVFFLRNGKDHSWKTVEDYGDWCVIWTRDRFSTIPPKEDKEADGFNVNQWMRENALLRYSEKDGCVTVHPDYTNAPYEVVLCFPKSNLPKDINDPILDDPKYRKMLNRLHHKAPETP